MGSIERNEKRNRSAWKMEGGEEREVGKIGADESDDQSG